MSKGALTDGQIKFIKAKLYAWGEYCNRQRPGYPSIDVAARYRYMLRLKEVGIAPPTTAGGHTSPQEAWAVRHQDQLHDAATIEKTLRRMTAFDRTIVWMRYVELARWSYIARELRRDRRTVYRAKRRILRLFAGAFGLLDK